MTIGTHSNTKTNAILGVVVVVLALIIGFIWIPADIDTGIFEKVRRRLEIGDAFAPTLATTLLGLGGALLIAEGLTSKSSLKVDARSLVFALGLLSVFAIFIALLLWTGPILVALFGAEGAEYRLLRDTAPWKYLGFITGGTFIVTALISFMEQRFTIKALVIGTVASLAMIILYDLPFDDLLLPPNGDF
jgi:hypothetical protein